MLKGLVRYFCSLCTETTNDVALVPLVILVTALRWSWVWCHVNTHQLPHTPQGLKELDNEYTVPMHLRKDWWARKGLCICQ